MKRLFQFALIALTLTTRIVFAQTSAPVAEAPTQDIAQLRTAITQFLSTQAIGLPGKIRVSVGSIDARLKLPACVTPEVFFPAASKAWGRTTVGVRCIAPSSWTIYVAATVHVDGEYVVATTSLSQGQSISQSDVAVVTGDLTRLPHGAITDPSQAIGRTTTSSIALGSPLREDALQNQQAIKQGQAVRVVVNGPGFSVTSEARALNNANEGQLTKVRTPSGQVIIGIAKLGGVIEMVY
jgi:flagella basal body P-ring formation protein FlgA